MGTTGAADQPQFDQGSGMTGARVRPMWGLLAILMSAELASASTLSMPVPGLAAWLRVFGDPVRVGWILTSYLLVAAATAALCGRLGDIYGRKRVLNAVLAIAFVGSLVSWLHTDFEWIIAGRAMQGVTGAVLPLCYGIVREQVPASRLSFAVGVIVATASGAGAISALAGGYLTDRFGPQSIFLALAALSLFAFLLVWLALPRSDTELPSGKFDWLGALLFSPPIAAILLALSNARRAGWQDPFTVGMLTAGISVLALWCWHERRIAHPLFDLKLFARRDAAIAYLIMACISVGMMQLNEATSLLLQQPLGIGPGLGTSATLVGILSFPALACGLATSVWAGWIGDRRGPRPALLVGGLLMSGSMVFAAFNHGSVGAVVIAIAFSTMGITMVYTAVPNVIIATVPAERVGEATGMMALIRAIMQGIGAQFIAILLSSAVLPGPAGAHYPADSAYRLVFIFLLACACGALALGLLVGRREKAPSTTAVALDSVTQARKS